MDTVSTLLDFNLRPQIVIGETDHRRLLALVLSVSGTALALLSELERAQVLADQDVPADVMSMDSRDEYRTSEGDARQVRLAWPDAADAAPDTVSVLTPLGTALIGLHRGQSITWTTEDGRRSVLTVTQVLNMEQQDPEPDPDPHYPSAA